jgi:hypothetical protein
MARSNGISPRRIAVILGRSPTTTLSHLLSIVRPTDCSQQSQERWNGVTQDFILDRLLLSVSESRLKNWGVWFSVILRESRAWLIDFLLLPRHKNMESQMAASLAITIPNFEVDSIEHGPEYIGIVAHSVRLKCCCLECGQVGWRVHSWYTRRPMDVPCMGHVALLPLKVRRFFCDNAGCERRTFAEHFSHGSNPTHDGLSGFWLK